jgi:RNA 2',3'-cyclic 3'-phosphodiesterase
VENLKPQKTIFRPPSQRLFFALWPPDEGIRAALAALARPYARRGSRRIHPANLHLTLAFAGSVSAAQRDSLVQGAGALRATAFDLHLDYLCNWHHNGILWAGSSQSDPALITLAADLNTLLDACGLRAEKRAYQAHVTLMREVYHSSSAPVPITPLSWSAHEFVLVESCQEAGRTVYKIIQTWKLA